MIHELNCFEWNSEGEREYFGIEIEPTEDLDIALEKARESDKCNDEVFVCGVYVDGNCHDGGVYRGLWEYKRDSIVPLIQ